MGNQRHAQGPAELHRLYVFADSLTFNYGEILQPFSNRLTTGICHEKACSQGWGYFFLHDLVYQLWYELNEKVAVFLKINSAAATHRVDCVPHCTPPLAENFAPRKYSGKVMLTMPKNVVMEPLFLLTH
jgi:hypothetical protein